MTDLLQLVWDLGKVAEQAALRGEDRAAATVREATTRLLEFGAEVAALERRRANDRKRKHKDSTESEESAKSTESAEAPKVSPDPFLTPKTPQHRAREGEAKETFPDFAEQMGDLWSSVERFLMRRDSSTWRGWVRQMRKEIGPGSQYTSSDLAHVCDDDEALSSPIGSPAGLRGFLLKSRTERLSGDALPNGNGAHSTRRARFDADPGLEGIDRVIAREKAKSGAGNG